ncbi:MAG TPA: 3'-5' exonuclease, partial [Oscillospiraceae bacterium]|nr:3'-5' exonuclease [Oscillospiraceae bacterium]
VYLIGMEEGIFPSARSTFSQEDIEEERRLAYVAITRAKEVLHITNAYSRILYGSTSRNPSSRFFNEIPKELIESLNAPQTRINKVVIPFTPKSKTAPSGSVSPAQKQASPQITYKVGDMVEHKAFGRGLLISMEKTGNDYLLEVAFDTVGTKKLMANFAKLQKVPSE